MAYIVTRNNTSGYVALVEKKRVPVAGNKTSVRNVGYICGLGVMDQGEFEEFRDWAHAIKHQESRKEAVLACPRVVKKTKETKAVIAGEQQKATTVKPMRKAKTVWKAKTGVRKHYPVPGLPGYRGKTHTKMMMERRKEAILEKMTGTKQDESLASAERVHKRHIKGLMAREKRLETAKIRRAKSEGFMFD